MCEHVWGEETQLVFIVCRVAAVAVTAVVSRGHKYVTGKFEDECTNGK